MVGAGVVALLAAALAGCIKVDMNLSLEGERVDGNMILGMDREFLAFLDGLDEGEGGPSAADGFLEGLIGDQLSQTEGVTVEPWEDDAYVGARYTFDSVDLADFQQGTGEGSLSIDYDAAAGTYEVTGRFDLTDELGPPSEAEAEEFGLPPGTIEQMMESFDITVSIAFPGEVLEHNGELADTTVTWRPQVGEETEIYALAAAVGTGPGADAGGVSGQAGGGSASLTTALLVALAVLVLASGAGLGFWFARRHRQPAVASGATTTPPQAPGWFGASPPTQGGYQPPPHAGYQPPTQGGYQPPPQGGHPPVQGGFPPPPASGSQSG